MSKAKIQTTNGVVELDEDLARMSPLLTGLIDESGLDEEIPVEICKEALELVVEYLTKVKENGEEPTLDAPIISNDIENACTDEWFVNFVKDRDAETLFMMANAGVALQLTGFTDLATLKIACEIKGKKMEEIRGFFGVANDFDEGEEDLIDEENKFASEYF